MGQTGIFISFEGGEGSGKTTQINRLTEAISAQGYKITTTREPGGTPEGDLIRRLLLTEGMGNWTPESECLLVFAGRSLHIGHVIRPALNDNKIVLCDRFIDSTYAYQGYGHGLDRSYIESLDHLVTGSLRPDLTFVFDIDPEIGLKRSGRRLAAESLKIEREEDRFENMDIGFHHRVRQGFLDIAKENPRRCVVLDATQTIEQLAAIVSRHTLEFLEKAKS